jgi:hypothetical protein
MLHSITVLSRGLLGFFFYDGLLIHPVYYLCFFLAWRYVFLFLERIFLAERRDGSESGGWRKRVLSHHGMCGIPSLVLSGKYLDEFNGY